MLLVAIVPVAVALLSLVLGRAASDDGERWASRRLLVLAGAMTVAELSAVGLPAAYVPLPIGNGEQRLNAQPVVKAGGGLLVDDAELTPQWVQQNVLPVLANPHRLYEMSRAASEFGRRDADELLVGMVYEAIASRHRH